MRNFTNLFSNNKNVTIIGLGIISGQAIAFGFFTLLVRWISKEEYGEIQYIINIAILASNILLFGLPTTMTRFLAKYSNKPKIQVKFYSNIIYIFLIMLFLMEIIILILFFNNIHGLVILGISIPTFYISIIRGLMQFKKFSVISSVRNLIKIIFLIIFFYSIGISKNSVIIIYSFCGWIGILILELILPKGIRFNKKHLSKKMVKIILKFSFPIYISTLIFSLFMVTPILILEWFWNFQILADYSAAQMITAVYTIIPIAIVTIIMPKIALEKNYKKQKQIFSKSIYIIIISGFILWILTILFGRWGIILLFTTKYINSYWPLVILALSSIFIGVKQTFSAFWEGRGFPIISTFDVLGGCLTTIILSIIFIPYLKAIGAAISFTLGWSVSILINVYFWIKIKNKTFKLKFYFLKKMINI